MNKITNGEDSIQKEGMFRFRELKQHMNFKVEIQNLQEGIFRDSEHQDVVTHTYLALKYVSYALQ